MTEKMPQDQMNKMYFMNLVIMLGSTAMQQLGKMVNPVTNKEELDLQGAQATIDLLSALKAKTEGNLDDEEGSLLGQTISSLQMNFVDTSSKATEGGAVEPEDTEAEEADEPEGPTEDAAEPSAESGDKKDPKFKKTY